MLVKEVAEIIDSMDHIIEEQQKLIKVMRNALLQYMTIEEIEKMEKESLEK